MTDLQFARLMTLIETEWFWQDELAYNWAHGVKLAHELLAKPRQRRSTDDYEPSLGNATAAP